MRADGESIGGYALSNFSASLSEDNWAVSFYIDNLFDKYAFVSARGDKSDIGLALFPEENANGPEISRSYGHYLLSPRKIGLKFTYNFEL